MSAFQATYTDLRIVKGRKMVQIILEVAQENAEEALAVLGGLPRPDLPVWVGVARLDKTAAQEAPQKERRPFHELPLPQQAALLCQDERFQAWVSRAFKENDTAEWLRNYLDVESRAALATDRLAADRYHALVARYRQETGQETWRP